ncbi:MAG: hypothetical protein ACRDOI_00205, partial [Trebonia sp.]
MADVSYAPGALTAVVGDQCWALVEAAPDSPAVARIWQQLGQGGTADALLVGLVVDGPGGIPGFTLLVVGSGGQHRLFCRGTVGATVVTGPADTPERIDGAGLLTWHERVVGNAERIFLGEPPADTSLRLPATSGVLLAGSVIVDLTDFVARETVSYEPDQPKKTIVLFPDTITMTSPGSLVGWASAGQPMPGDRGPVILPTPAIALPAGPVPLGPVPPGPVPAGLLSAGPPLPLGPLSAIALPPGPVGPAGPVVPEGHSSGPLWPEIPGSGAFPAPGMPLSASPSGMSLAAGPAVPVAGPQPPGVPGAPGGPGRAGGPGPVDGRAADDDEREFLWGVPSRTVADGAIEQVSYPGTPPPPPAAPPWPSPSEGAWAGGPR